MVSWSSRPRVKTAKRAVPLGALREKHDGSVSARWRESTVRPAVGVGGPLRTPVVLPARDALPLSTLDRHSSSFRWASKTTVYDHVIYLVVD